MKSIITLLLLFGSAMLFAQQEDFLAPDYALIEKNINDKDSEYYYPLLMEKLEKNDTVFTDEQYRHLYYGYVFHENYNPYGRFSKQNEINGFFNLETLSKEDFQRAFSLIDEALKENPFDLDTRNILFLLKNSNGETEEASKILTNLLGLLRTIIESGDGMKCETAFHVISPRDEYAVMGVLGIQSLGQALMGSCDLQRIDEDEHGISRLFFDISKPFAKLRSSFD
jgi:hypothetical protein